jgi:tetratricopeptide (TPR) repeat protein
LAVEFYLLERASQNVKYLTLIPGITLIWANMHAAFILSLIILGAYCLEALAYRKQVRAWFLTFGISSVAALINPYGYNIYAFTLSFLQKSFYTQHLNEWSPPDFKAKVLFLVFLLLLLAGSLAFIKRIKLSEGLILCLFIYMALSAVRHITLFYFVASLPLALIINESWNYIKKPINLKPQGLQVLTVIILMLWMGLLLLGFVHKKAAFPLSNLSMEKSMFPVEAVKFISSASLSPPLFNPYGWGGYLIWKLYPGYKVFIDGRINTLYSEKVYEDSLRVSFGEDNWEAILNHYKINFIISNRRLLKDNYEILPLKIKTSHAWVKVYEDDNTWIYVRNQTLNLKVISFYKCYQTALAALKTGDLISANKHFSLALTLISYAPAYVWRGYTYAVNNQILKAERDFQQALALDSQVSSAHYNLGEIYRNLGNRQRAIAEFKAELKLNPEFKAALNSLRELQP